MVCPCCFLVFVIFILQTSFIHLLFIYIIKKKTKLNYIEIEPEKEDE